MEIEESVRNFAEFFRLIRSVSNKVSLFNPYYAILPESIRLWYGW